jgi:hypothetical protein
MCTKRPQGFLNWRLLAAAAVEAIRGIHSGGLVITGATELRSSVSRDMASMPITNENQGKTLKKTQVVKVWTAPVIK